MRFNVVLLLGIGFGLVLPTMSLVVQNAVSYEYLGVASSSSQFFRQIGSVLGIAVFGAVLANVYHSEFAGRFTGSDREAVGSVIAAELDDPTVRLNEGQYAVIQKQVSGLEGGPAILENAEVAQAESVAVAVRMIFTMAFGAALLCLLFALIMKELPLRRTVQGATAPPKKPAEGAPAASFVEWERPAPEHTRDRGPRITAAPDDASPRFGSAAAARAGFVAVTLMPGELTLDAQPGVENAQPFYQRVIELATSHPAFTGGALVPLVTDAPMDVIAYARADGRNRPGVDVPHPFDGAFTVTVRAEGTASAGFVLVRLQAKAEPPLLALRNSDGLFAISTIATVTFYGHDQTGRAVSVSGKISIEFADWADKES